MKKVLLLGATGSIGSSALDVLRDLEDTHKLVGMTGHTNAEGLIDKAKEFTPSAVGITDPKKAGEVRQALRNTGIDVLEGEKCLCALIEDLNPDIVLLAVSGAVGLLPALTAMEKGKILALANKESLVMAGHILMRKVGNKGARIVPVDSEHSAIFQAMHGQDLQQVRRIILTASGGPFVSLPAEAFSRIRPEDALKHPTWNMGEKITIDSATMMNKALEIIEARWLFDLPVDKISVVVHRQSIVHGMVEFVDGSVLAQMGTPDMKLPIRLALTHPDRFPSNQSYFDPDQWSKLTFEKPDDTRFPAVNLGFRAAREAGLAGTVLNAANETAVELFLKGEIAFDDITRSVNAVMDSMKNKKQPPLDEILMADRWAREETVQWFSH